jgi:hypothetical protein
LPPSLRLGGLAAGGNVMSNVDSVTTTTSNTVVVVVTAPSASAGGPISQSLLYPFSDLSLFRT